MKRLFRKSLCALACSFAVPGVAWAEASQSDGSNGIDTDPLTEKGIVGDSELDDQRGGFTLQGMNITMGADIRTYMNGDLALQTTVNWTDSGAVTTQTVSAILTPAAARDLQMSALSGTKFSLSAGGSSVYYANDGQTALVHRTDNGIQNVLVNAASNQNIVQQVDATVNIEGYEGFRTDMVTSRLGESLGSAISGSMLGTLGR